MGLIGRGRLLAALGAVLLAAPPVVHAQSPAKTYRIGYLSVGIARPTGPDDPKAAFVASLRELGYTEGANVVVEWRGAQGSPDRLSALAAELVDSKVDVIVSTSDATHGVLRRATNRIPVVMLISQDPVRRGLVASLARPGGNITGLSTVLIDVGVKQLELLRAILPRATKVAYLRDDTRELPEKVAAASLQSQASAARALGFTLLPFVVRERSDLEPTFAAIAREHVDALQVAFTPFTYRNREEIVKLANRAGLPALVPETRYTEAGGFLSYGIDMRMAARQGARYVARILRGARPGDLPIEQPSEFDLVVNARTARSLGITIPPEILLRASRVIE